jgi:hypothetical protein
VRGRCALTVVIPLIAGTVSLALAAPAGRIGEVLSVEGSAIVERPTSPASPLAIGQALLGAERIMVGNRSLVRLKLGGALVPLGEASSVTIGNGPFGAAGARRFDVIGKAVNTAATLADGSGVTLSVSAFRKLGPELRRRFHKHTPPITYIRLEDPRRPRG